MGGGGQETFDRAASEKSAALVRDQWQDYKTRFQPQEKQFLDDAGIGIKTTVTPSKWKYTGKAKRGGAHGIRQWTDGKTTMWAEKMPGGAPKTTTTTYDKYGGHTKFFAEESKQAANTVNQAYVSANQQQNQDRARFGMAATKGQLAAQTNNNAINRTASMADAINTTSQHDIDRRNEMIGGGINSASQLAKK